jgi:hypothetical protein
MSSPSTSMASQHRIVNQIQFQQNREVAQAYRNFLRGLNMPPAAIDAAIRDEIKEAAWDPALMKPLETASQKEIELHNQKVSGLTGFLKLIEPNIQTLWEELRKAGFTITADRVIAQPIPGVLGATISDDLSAALNHVGRGFQPVKLFVNILRHIKTLERQANELERSVRSAT